jgi:hypothetical protein
MTPQASLYRVNKRTLSWTLVVASSEEHAKIIARKLTDQAFAEEVRCSAKEIRSVTAIPKNWEGCLPWVDPGREHLYEDFTCEDVIWYARAHQKAVKGYEALCRAGIGFWKWQRNGNGEIVS